CQIRGLAGPGVEGGAYPNTPSASSNCPRSVPRILPPRSGRGAYEKAPRRVGVVLPSPPAPTLSGGLPEEYPPRSAAPRMPSSGAPPPHPGGATGSSSACPSSRRLSRLLGVQAVSRPWRETYGSRLAGSPYLRLSCY